MTKYDIALAACDSRLATLQSEAKTIQAIKEMYERLRILECDHKNSDGIVLGCCTKCGYCFG